MAHGKTIQKEKGAYKFFTTNGSLLTTQFLNGDSVMDEYISLAGELRLAETIFRYGGKDNFADLLKRAAVTIENLSASANGDMCAKCDKTEECKHMRQYKGELPCDCPKFHT